MPIPVALSKLDHVLMDFRVKVQGACRGTTCCDEIGYIRIIIFLYRDQILAAITILHAAWKNSKKVPRHHESFVQDPEDSFEQSYPRILGIRIISN